MVERLYTEFPELYDAIQSDYDYDRDLEVLETVFSARGLDGGHLLEVGCGTGEHSRRLVDVGYTVTAVDKHEGMVSVARNKCDGTFYVDALPALTVEGSFDAVIAIRGVINHVLPDEFDGALDAMIERLSDGGVLLFDNSRLPRDGNDLMLDVGATDAGDYARLAQHVATDEGHLEWRSLFIGADGTFFVNARPMWPYRDERIESALIDRGLAVETRDGFGPGDRRTVFIAEAR